MLQQANKDSLKTVAVKRLTVKRLALKRLTFKTVAVETQCLYLYGSLCSD